LINNSKKRAPLFSWDITGRKALMALETNFQKNQKCAKICLPKLSEVLNQIAQGCNRVSDEILVDISNSLEPLYSTRKNVGWITTWNSRCGIAKYSEYLICGKYKNLFILAPKNEKTVKEDSCKIKRCWNLGSGELDDLFHEVIKNEIWIIVIQFNYGFFEYKKLSDLIKKLVISGRSVFMTIHSTQDPKDENKNLAILKDTLSLCKKVFVHCDYDNENLRKKEILKNVEIIPQGIYNQKSNQFNYQKSTSRKNIIASYGFFLPKKGLLELLTAFNILIKKGADIELLMINSEYSNSASKSLITAANKFIVNEKIDQRVTLITDFLDEEKSLALLQKAHLLVFPYQEGDGPSAAVRMGIASGVPVAVTPLPTFDDLEDVVFRLPGIDPQSVAIGLEQILNNEKALAEMKAKAAQWSDERLIPRVSKKFFHLISS
jgi:glycosyltransferase involved in cell wall biosynthesis